MPVLGYWKIRGLAQPIRLMLGYLDIDFEDKMYEVTDGPEFSRDAWLKEKFTLGTDGRGKVGERDGGEVGCRCKLRDFRGNFGGTGAISKFHASRHLEPFAGIFKP